MLDTLTQAYSENLRLIFCFSESDDIWCFEIAEPVDSSKTDTLIKH